MSEHEHAQILRWIANGEQLQVNTANGGWADASADWTLGILSRNKSPATVFRVKPRIILINGIKVPEPMREAPKEGTTYWIASIGEKYEHTQMTWDGLGSEQRWLARGLCHETQEGAEAHARALLSFMRRD